MEVLQKTDFEENRRIKYVQTSKIKGYVKFRIATKEMPDIKYDFCNTLDE